MTTGPSEDPFIALMLTLDKEQVFEQVINEPNGQTSRKYLDHIIRNSDLLKDLINYGIHNNSTFKLAFEPARHYKVEPFSDKSLFIALYTLWCVIDLLRDK